MEINYIVAIDLLETKMKSEDKVFNSAYVLAVEALEKQIAKKPSIEGMQNKCQNIDCFENVLRYYDYCSGCGQKIDWSKD